MAVKRAKPPKRQPKVPDGFRRCADCQKVLPEKDFPNKRIYYCMPCHLTRQEKYKAERAKREWSLTTLKSCLVCKQTKPIAAFHKNVGGKFNRASKCKPCLLQLRRQTQISHHLKTAHGLTEEDYLTLLKSQDGVCAVCGLPPGKTRLFVDHDHKTDLIRGLLHLQCNTAVGFIENAVHLERIIGYIRNSGTKAIKKLHRIRHARLIHKAAKRVAKEAARAKKTARLKKVATRRPRPPNVDSGLTSAEAAAFLRLTLGALLYHDRRGTLKPRYVHRNGRLVKTYASVELEKLKKMKRARTKILKRGGT